METRLRAVLADPMGWLAPERCRYTGSLTQGVSRDVLNNVICRHFLADQPVSLQQSDGERLLLDNWFWLRSTAVLMACQRYRPTLNGHPSFHFLPDSARMFMALNLIPGRFLRGAGEGLPLLLRLAGAELVMPEEAISPSLQKMTACLFPPETGAVAAEYPVSFSLTLFRMALQHAKKTAFTL